MWQPGTAKGVGRSLDIYYRDPARWARMVRLHRQLVGASDLVFDIGAHLGDRIASFRRLGARVVAAEPQPAMARALRLLHGRDPQVHLVPAAVGAAPGETRLRLNTANPTVATASPTFVETATVSQGWQQERWDAEIPVPQTTLDALIAAHGRPDFVKIDVEGLEADVLAGLSTALPLLSFEITTMMPQVGAACLDRLDRLGRYRFNLALGESHRMVSPRWQAAGEMHRTLAALPYDANSGDVYARAVR